MTDLEVTIIRELFYHVMVVVVVVGGGGGAVIYATVTQLSPLSSVPLNAPFIMLCLCSLFF